MKKELFLSHIDPIAAKLQRFAQRMLGDPEESKDALQEVIAKLWSMRGKLDEYRSIEALAMRMTRNQCLDRLKAIRPVGLEHLPERSSATTPQTVLEGSDAAEKVRTLLQKLPEQQRRIVELRDFDGFEYEEIAHILDTNVNSVRVNISRARKKLREGLIKIYAYEQP